MAEDSIFRWTGTELTLLPADMLNSGGRLRVAESWLLSDGQTRSLLNHYRRFQRATSAWRESPPLWDFLTAVTESMPRRGHWVAQIEYLHGDDRSPILQLRTTAPAPHHHTVSLWTHPAPDPRTYPAFLGPDWAMMLQLRRQANMYGADDSVLLDTSGHVLGTTFDTIAWWRAETLCLPPYGPRVTGSVTREIVEDIAHASGVSIRYEEVSPEELTDHEVWTICDLYGIRSVSRWMHDGTDIAPAPSQRARLWQRRLAQFALPLPQSPVLPSAPAEET